MYSDSAIHITREKSIIEGVGFESNEEMSKYTIMHPTGVFPIDEEETQPAAEETVIQKDKSKEPVVPAKEEKSSKFKVANI